MARAHERRPYAGRRPSCFPPTGCPTRRPSPARWCSYAYCRSLHITSFRSREPYPNAGPSASATFVAVQAAGRSPDGARSRRAPRAPCRGSGPSPAGTGSGRMSTTTSGVSPTSWIQRLFGVSHLRDGQLERAALAGELLPLLDGALAERLLADERRPSGVLERAATISLADALPPSMRQTTVRLGSVATPSGEGVGRDLDALGVLLPEDRPRRDELARDRRGPRSRSRPGSPRRSRISVVRPASTCAASASRRAVAPVSEKPVSRTYPTVPSARSWLMTSCSWTTSRVIARSNGGGVAALDRSASTTEPFGPRIRSRAPSTVRPSSEVPSVARMRSPAQQPGLLGGRAGDRGDDHEPAVRPERRAALRAVGRLRGDLRADPLELAADPLQALAVLVGGQVRGVRVAERVDHPPDGALDEDVAVDLAAGVAVVDRVVRVPERLERASSLGRACPGSVAGPAARASSRT